MVTTQAMATEPQFLMATRDAMSICNPETRLSVSRIKPMMYCPADTPLMGPVNT